MPIDGGACAGSYCHNRRVPPERAVLPRVRAHRARGFFGITGQRRTTQRDGSLTSSGRPRPMLTIVCEPCRRRGRSAFARLIDEHGDAKLPDLLLTFANCPKTRSLLTIRPPSTSKSELGLHPFGNLERNGRYLRILTIASPIAEGPEIRPELPFPVGTRYGRNAHMSGPSVENRQTGAGIWANVATRRQAR